MSFKSTFLNLLLVFILIYSSNAQEDVSRSYYQDEGLIPRERSVDFTHLKLSASFKPEEGLILAEVEEHFKVLRKSIDSLFLDAVNIEFLKVELNQKEVNYRIEKKGITLLFDQALNWGSEQVIRIKYRAKPQKGLYFIGWNDPSGRSRKQIWTQGQGINNRHWIPMYDEKNDLLTTEMFIDFDENYEVLSNGVKMKEKKIGNDKKRWHYKISHPHAPYLIMLGIGKYEIEEKKSASGIPLKFYYYPDEKDHLQPTYHYSLEMFEFLEKEIGVPYPWKTYAQIPVQDFMYGAMENTTATIFGDFYMVNSRGFRDKNYVRVNAHELAHQWFGDFITARSSAHHWLQESFATHYDLVIQGEAFGQDHFDWVRRSYNQQALDASKTDFKPIAHSTAGTVRHYPKGALVLQMLKYVVGKSQFNAAIKYYLEKHAHGNVDSKNLLIAFHERLGLSLNWFWEEWIKRGGEPHYQVELIQSKERLSFYVRQTHEQSDLVGLFKMPIDFQLYFKDGTQSKKKVWIEEESHLVHFEIPSGKEVDFALFDPNSQVLKSVDFPKSTEMLIAQATKADGILDRYDATEELLARDFPGKDAFLMERLKTENFYAIPALIIGYFVPQLDSNSTEVVKWVLANDSTDSKKALLDNTLRIPDHLAEEYVKLLYDSSYEVAEKALELLSFYRPQETEKYLEILKDEKGNRGHNIRIKWLEIAYLSQADEAYLTELADYTSPAFEFRTRVNAAKAIRRLNVLTEQALENMMQGMFSFNRRLSSPMRSVIDHFFDQNQFKAEILNFVVDKEWTDKEFKKVKKYLAY